MKLTGAQIIIETLIEQGVETVFGYPGGTVLDIYDQLYKNSDRVQHVRVSHEQHAAHAAEHVSEWWGIVSVEMIGGRADIYELRTASANPRVKGPRKIGILWRSELNRLLKLNKLPVCYNRSKAAAAMQTAGMIHLGSWAVCADAGALRIMGSSWM